MPCSGLEPDALVDADQPHPNRLVERHARRVGEGYPGIRVHEPLAAQDGHELVVQATPDAAPVERSVQWDGKTGALTSLVPLGVYYYRVYGVDQAGNWSQSGESQRITIRIL